MYLKAQYVCAGRRTAQRGYRDMHILSLIIVITVQKKIRLLNHMIWNDLYKNISSYFAVLPLYISVWGLDIFLRLIILSKVKDNHT